MTAESTALEIEAIGRRSIAIAADVGASRHIWARWDAADHDPPLVAGADAAAGRGRPRAGRRAARRSPPTARSTPRTPPAARSPAGGQAPRRDRHERRRRRSRPPPSPSPAARARRPAARRPCRAARRRCRGTASRSGARRAGRPPPRRPVRARRTARAAASARSPWRSCARPWPAARRPRSTVGSSPAGPGGVLAGREAQALLGRQRAVLLDVVPDEADAAVGRQRRGDEAEAVVAERHAVVGVPAPEHRPVDLGRHARTRRRRPRSSAAGGSGPTTWCPTRRSTRP